MSHVSVASSSRWCECPASRVGKEGVLMIDKFCLVPRVRTPLALPYGMLSHTARTQNEEGGGLVLD